VRVCAAIDPGYDVEFSAGHDGVGPDDVGTCRASHGTDLAESRYDDD
jgi:hypothetical protein